MGALGGGRDYQFRGRDNFVAGRMMLADPCLVEADLVEMLDQIDIAAQRERRAGERMNRRGKSWRVADQFDQVAALNASAYDLC